VATERSATFSVSCGLQTLRPMGQISVGLNAGIPTEIFPSKYEIRGYGRENGSTDFVPVFAEFFRFFSCFLFLLIIRYTVGLCGIRCRSGWDFPVLFSSLAGAAALLKYQWKDAKFKCARYCPPRVMIS
jgi:hypothetical protein